jgi:hypothetical protein
MEAGSKTGHVLFVPSPQGYRIEEREGDEPEQGAEIDLGDRGRFVVNRVGPSPFPLDQRRCAYLVRHR